MNEKSEAWKSSDNYDLFMGRWSSLIAQDFIVWLRELSKLENKAWLDIGCGTGSLTEQIYKSTQYRRILGIDPSPEYIEKAKNKIKQANVDFRVGVVGNIPKNESKFDIAVSGLVLNFIRNLEESMEQIRLLLNSKGFFACYVWDYSDQMEYLRYFWDSAAIVDENSRIFDEGKLFSICSPDQLRNLFLSHGYQNIIVKGLTIKTKFSTFDDFWSPFLGGQGPAGVYLQSVDPITINNIKNELESQLPISNDGSINLLARVWAIKGDVE